MLVFSTRLQGRSSPMVIHTKVGQGPFQLVHCHSLVFSRTLSTSNLHHDRTKVQLHGSSRWLGDSTLASSGGLSVRSGVIVSHNVLSLLRWVAIIPLVLNCCIKALKDVDVAKGRG